MNFLDFIIFCALFVGGYFFCKKRKNTFRDKRPSPLFIPPNTFENIEYCSNFCRLRYDTLSRSTHKKCATCNHCVSEYEHRVCMRCATQPSVEYDYHHKNCKHYKFRHLSGR